MKAEPSPMITRYRIFVDNAQMKRPLRAALVSDLHNRPCDAALAAIKREKPDLILIAGDLMECYAPDDLEVRLNDIDEQSADEPRWKKALYRAMIRADALISRSDKDFDIDNANALRFLREAVLIAPTLYTTGNHERFMRDETRREVIETGARLLDNESARLTVNGGEVLVGGLSSRFDRKWLAGFAEAKTDGVKLLICHHPEYYERMLEGLNVGVIFSGHAHGGQLRVLGRPLFAPGQGLLPKYSGGVYNDRLVVGRGLSNTAHIPRYGNPTELVMVEIAKKR